MSLVLWDGADMFGDDTAGAGDGEGRLASLRHGAVRSTLTGLLVLEYS
jgi:hypothetical protein